MNLLDREKLAKICFPDELRRIFSCLQEAIELAGVILLACLINYVTIDLTSPIRGIDKT
jgi:hypothetical protein